MHASKDVVVRDAASGTEESRGHRSIRSYMRLGGVTVVVLFGGLAGWAAMASISGAVIAPASVVVESNSRTVQHLDGGIIDQILVKDGDTVAAGDLLMRLDPTVPAANLAIVNHQLDELLAQQARLDAEREQRSDIVFPEELLKRRNTDPHAETAIRGQTALFNARRNALESQKAQLREQIRQIDDEITGLAAQRDAASDRIKLFDQELEGLTALSEKGLISISRVLSLKREAAQLEGERGNLIAQIAQAKMKQGETEIQILQFDRNRQADVNTELRDVQTKIAELEEKRIAAEDELKRLDIRAPRSGRIFDLAFHTIGGVVKAGEPILKIVPTDDYLVIEARVSARDIDQVHQGQTAAVRFPSFDERATPELLGTVREIAADLTQDKVRNSEYYKVQIKLDDGETAKLGDKKLLPGMPADAFIQTVPRSPLSYLIKPLTDQMHRAFREE